MTMRTMRRNGLLALLSAAVLLGVATAEAADRTIEPGATRHRHVRVQRAVKVKHVKTRVCVDDRAAIRPLKYVIRCAVVSAAPRW